MKKSAVTLEVLDQKIDAKIVFLDQKIDKLIIKLDQKFDGIDQRFDTLEQKVEDNTTSFQFLIEHTVMREEMYQAIDERLDSRLIPMESRLLAAIDGIGK